MVWKWLMWSLQKPALTRMRQKSLQSCRHNLPEVEPRAMPGAHLLGAKAFAGSFAMSRFVGDSAPRKRREAKAFSILPGLLPLGKCNISCSYDQCSANWLLKLRVYVFRYQNRVNTEVNSVSGKIGRFDEFDRVNSVNSCKLDRVYRVLRIYI